MRATKLLSVSVTLWAVVVGADSASAGMPSLSPPIKPNMATPPVRGVGVGGTLPAGIKSGARAIIKQPVGVGGTLPTGINSGAMIRQPVGVGGTRPPGLILAR